MPFRKLTEATAYDAAALNDGSAFVKTIDGTTDTSGAATLASFSDRGWRMALHHNGTRTRAARRRG